MLGAPRKSRAFTNDYFIFATQALVDPECRIDFAVSGHWTVPARHAPGPAVRLALTSLSGTICRRFQIVVSRGCLSEWGMFTRSQERFSNPQPRPIHPELRVHFRHYLAWIRFAASLPYDSSHGRVGRRPPSIRLPGRLLSVAGIVQIYSSLMYSGKHSNSVCKNAF